MTTPSPKIPRQATIALVDWITPGHHTTYMQIFARALLEAGHHVIALWPEPEKFMNSMKTIMGDDKQPCQRLAAGYLHRPHYPLWPAAFRYWAEASKTVSELKNALTRCEKKLQRSCDFIFFNSLYENQTWLMRPLADAGGHPWSFLYLHTTSLPPHSQTNPKVLDLMQHPNLKAIAVLDERSVAPGELLTGKKIIHFPDTTDVRFQAGHPLEKELRAFKGGAPLVLAIGHLRAAKGFTTLLEATFEPVAKNLKFAFIGQCKPNKMERRLIDKARRQNPNVYFKLEPLPDELDYNACIRASDVIFAAFHNFAHSSNTLAKAAVFEKPIVVSDGQLMAERVRQYRLGEIVRQKDPVDALAGIQRIAGNAQAWVELHKPDWQGYRTLHSQNRLGDAFNQLLDAYRQDPAQSARMS